MKPSKVAAFFEEFIRPLRPTTWAIIGLSVALAAVLLVGNLKTERTTLTPYVQDNRGSSAFPDRCTSRSSAYSQPIRDGSTLGLTTPSGETFTSQLSYIGYAAFLDFCLFEVRIEDVPIESGNYFISIDGKRVATIDDREIQDEYLTVQVR